MKPRRNDLGQSLVEWALILPIFILLVMGMAEIGNIFSKQHMVNQITKEIARTASIGDSTENIRLRAQELSKLVIKAETATVSHTTTSTTITVKDSSGKEVIITFEPALANRKKGSPVKATTVYVYTPITPFLNLNPFEIKSHYSTLVEVSVSSN